MASNNNIVKDGWDDDDDDLNVDNGDWSFDDDNMLDQSNHVSKEDQPRVVDTGAAQQEVKPTSTLDKDDKEEDNHNDEWSFQDDDILSDNDTESNNQDAEPSKRTTSPPAAAPSDASNNKEMTQYLVSYLESLPAFVSSINAIFMAEYNTDIHAMELLDYYKERPQLKTYTLETELPRMDYCVVASPTQTLEDKQQVYQYLVDHTTTSDDNVDLLVRGANQSLLPDVLAVMTSNDGMVRPQVLASTRATSCRFTLVWPESKVSCECTLNLTLPNGKGQPWDVAEFGVRIDFDVRIPQIEYKLTKVDLLVTPTHQVLQDTAQFLESLHLSPQDAAPQQESTKNDAKFRDAFMRKLFDPKKLVQDTSTGLSYAVKQIDSVANVSSKVEYLTTAAAATMANNKTSLLPTLPTKEQLQQVADLTTTTHTTHNEATKTHAPAATRGPHAPPPGNPDPHDRPAPILGGLLMSGLSRLAKHVALPEEDPSLYHGGDETNNNHAIPKLYRNEEAPPQLYRKEEQQQRPPPPPPPRRSKHEKPRRPPPPPSPPVSGNRQSRRPPPPSPPGNSAKQSRRPPPPPSPPVSGNNSRRPPPPPPKRTTTPAVVQDGWDEQDDLLNNISNEAEAPTPRFLEIPKPQPSDNHVSNWEYNEEDDIIETRTRWVNPRFAAGASTG